MYNESMPKKGHIPKEILDVLPENAFFTLQDWRSDGSYLHAKLRLKNRGDRFASLNLPAWHFHRLINRKGEFVFISAKSKEDLQRALSIIARKGCPLTHVGTLEEQEFLIDKICKLFFSKAEGFYYKFDDLWAVAKP